MSDIPDVPMSSLAMGNSSPFDEDIDDHDGENMPRYRVRFTQQISFYRDLAAKSEDDAVSCARKVIDSRPDWEDWFDDSDVDQETFSAELIVQ